MSINNPSLGQVVLVEDALPMQHIIKMSLKDRFQVTIFNSGIEALNHLYKGHLPHIIISDLNIPEISGLELLAQLKSSSLFSAIPVLILSGEDSTDVRIDCLEAGADDYMVKPFNPRELEVRIRNILSRPARIIN